MKSLIKIFFWIAAGIVLFLVTLIIATSFLKDQAISVIMNSVNNRISTRIEFGNHRLSLMRRFPRASVELKNVTVFSSPVFDSKQFDAPGKDTLLKAETVALEFSLQNLIKRNYTIESITINNGVLSLLCDSLGGVNYEISAGSREKDDIVDISLEKVIFRNLAVNYANKATNLRISGLVENGKLRSRIRGQDMEFSFSSGILLRHFGLRALNVYPDARFLTETDLTSKNGEISFKKGVLKFDGFSFGVTGFIHPAREILLKITGQDIDLAKVRKYLPGKVLEKYNDYSPGGNLNAEAIISGLMSRTGNTLTEIKYSVGKGRIYNRKSKIQMDNINLSGKYTSGGKAGQATESFEITSCSFNIGNALYTGTFSLKNFKYPHIKINFSGDIIPDELQQFIKIPGLVSAEGSARLNLRLEGIYEKKEKYSVTDILKLNPQATIQLKALGINHRDERYSFRDATGHIMIASDLWAEDLAFTYNNQRFLVNGCFENFPGWLAGHPVKIKITGDLAAGNLNMNNFISESSVPDSRKKKALKLPDGVYISLNFRTDNFTWKKLETGKIKGTIDYKPGILTVGNFSANSFDGIVSGNFLAARQESVPGYVFQGKFMVNNINIKSCFNSFNNFGQNFIRSDNLSGSLSGSLKILMQLDSLFKPDARTVNAEGKYIIENGALVNFEPVRALSRFINITELENITFSRLENNLFIKNNYLAIPQMDIVSSAAVFSASGTHYFDNTYEYHIKAYLSELLSGKMRKNNLTSEFGAIEDDGLGRTSVFLKITGKGGDVKVTYDLKAAGSKIKASLNREKNNLKNILNEEYGLYKNDTLKKTETAPKPRFQIEWSETESTEIRQDTISGQKENIFNRILRKKGNYKQ